MSLLTNLPLLFRELTKKLKSTKIKTHQTAVFAAGTSGAVAATVAVVSDAVNCGGTGGGGGGDGDEIRGGTVAAITPQRRPNISNIVRRICEQKNRGITHQHR